MERRQRNHGLRKRCSCPRKLWAKCQHAWHFNFKWRGKSYRLSLEKEADNPITNRDEARLPGTNPPVMFGDKAVGGVALGDIEAWREARPAGNCIG